MSDDPLRKALAYARRGFGVLPVHWAEAGICACGDWDCESVGKHPLTSNGATGASRNEATISSWWKQWPRANIGLTLPGFCVLDIDPRNGGNESWEAFREDFGPFPDTPEVLTGGGGQHFYFKLPPGVELHRKAIDEQKYPGIDVKTGSGGYVVAPPSIHASGGIYAWEASCSSTIAELPASVLLHLLSPPVPGNGPATSVDAGVQIREGNRDNAMFKMACDLFRAGLARDLVLSALLEANQKQCAPPLAPAVVRAKVDSAAKTIERGGNAQSAVFTKPSPLATLTTRKLSSYTPEDVSWLWNQRIPRGKVTVLAGNGGEGKSFLTLGIAAAVTAGKALPGGFAAKPAAVLLWNGEDAPEDTLYARAANCGADLDRIHIIEDVDDDGRRVPFGLGHVPLLTAYIESIPEVELLVIDPITALLAEVDAHRDAELRSGLQPLVALARKCKIAVVMVMHLNKSDNATVLHRLSGSVAFGALARSVLFQDTHSQSGRKSVDTIKHNLAQGKPLPVEFRIGDRGIEWVGMAPDLTATEISAARAGGKTDRSGAAAEFLREYLGQGPKESIGIWSLAKERGISEFALKKAKATLGITAKKKGIGEGARWIWTLPSAKEDEEDGPTLATVTDLPLQRRRPTLFEEDGLIIRCEEDAPSPLKQTPLDADMEEMAALLDDERGLLA